MIAKRLSISNVIVFVGIKNGNSGGINKFYKAQVLTPYRLHMCFVKFKNRVSENRVSVEVSKSDYNLRDVRRFNSKKVYFSIFLLISQ